ncbi:MAG: hypothetical protein QOE71_3322, partial [Pseudonocardiales bacterium]|nr:hypothetical protein [Pseudonocardiales bacterium]
MTEHQIRVGTGQSQHSLAHTLAVIVRELTRVNSEAATSELIARLGTRLPGILESGAPETS